MYWIRSAVKRSQIFQSRIIPVPQRLYENHKRLQRVEAELKANLGRQPTRKELGDAVGMSETQVQRSFKAMDQRCFSLDAEVTNKLKPNSGDRENSSMYELVQSKTDDGTNKLKRIFVREDLIETLNRHLDPDAVDLLLLRYGLMDENGFSGPLTIAEVSSLVGLKPDKVRRMINNSLKQLKFLIGDEWEDFERVIE
jgi:DNA-directed RNA polymerase sigma subunit (sigma70/sigma32)